MGYLDSFKGGLLYSSLRMDPFMLETEYDYNFKEYRDVPYHEIFSYLICSLVFFCLSILFVKRSKRAVLRHALKE
jgi:hypothetical protein